MIYIVPVDKTNKTEVLALEPARNQRDFIETTKQCLQEAESLSLWKPVGIYEEEILVGFAMYGLWEEHDKSRVWMDRILIDQRYQGKGYGKEALNLLIDRIFEEYGCDKIYLSIHPENAGAEHLYLKLGFRFNGKVDEHGERIMVLLQKNENIRSGNDEDIR